LNFGGANYLYEPSFGPFSQAGIHKNTYPSIPLGNKNGVDNNDFRKEYFNKSVKWLYGKIWYRYTQNTKLGDAIDDKATIIKVDSTTVADSSGQIKIDDEIIDYRGKTANSFTGCTRGRYGTTAKAHSKNTTVKIIKTESGSSPPENFCAPTDDIENTGVNLKWTND